MQAPLTVYVPCRVSPGMFANEFAVEIQLPDGERISLFADHSLVRQTGADSYLKVTLLGSASAEESVMLLPTESIENGSRWLRLPQRELVGA